jgi:hypothetical protein
MTSTKQQDAGICIRMQEEPRVDAPRSKFDEWRAEGEELARRKKGLTAGFWQLQFDVGDWLIDCENYREGEEITGYSASTLRTFVYVARHVPFNLRYASVPWGIHQLVAPFKSDDDKELFLQSATQEGWSVSTARAHLAKAQSNGLFTSSVAPKSASDYTTQNNADKGVEQGEDKDEMEAFVSKSRLRQTIDRMRHWKPCPIADEDLARAMPLMWSVDEKTTVVKFLRRRAEELLNLAQRMEAVPLENQAKAAAQGAR